MQEITLELVGLGFLDCFLGVVHPIQRKIGSCEIEITEYICFETLALFGRS